MTHRRTTYRTAGAGALVIAVAASCADRQPEPLAVDRTDATYTAHHGRADDQLTSPEVRQWLAGLRNATAAFHDTASAAQAGWNAQITDCMELPGTGGMGYHIANVGLIDSIPQEFAPELLVYAPQRDGRRQLVAVEYIVPFTEWTHEAPPSLHGIDYHRNEAFGLWVLHAWVWKHNPAGMLEDWNPAVSCAFAQ